MSTDTDVTQELAPANGGAPPPPPPAQEDDTSILGGLRVVRKAIHAATTKVFPIPGWEDRLALGSSDESTPLACRYAVLPWEDDRKLTVKATNVSEDDAFRELHLYMDELIASCQEFGVLVAGEFVPFSSAKPVRWGDPRLPEALGLSAERKARAIVWAVFEDAHGPRAPYEIDAHHTAVIALWMRGRDGGAQADADEEFAKNS